VTTQYVGRLIRAGELAAVNVALGADRPRWRIPSDSLASSWTNAAARASSVAMIFVLRDGRSVVLKTARITTDVADYAAIMSRAETFEGFCPMEVGRKYLSDA
jgi:hypothetical protein